MLDIAVIIPQLEKYGGAERLAIECVTRWQHDHKITLYTTSYNPNILREMRITDKVVLRKLSPLITGTEYSFLINATYIPKVWEREIGRHDVYNTHLWLTHLIDKQPMVWYPNEPLRMLHDLRYNQDLMDHSTEAERKVHLYPKYDYDTIAAQLFEPMLDAVKAYDSQANPYRIVANSRYTAGYLEKVYDREITDIVYPGVNPDDFIPPMGSDYILTVAQLWQHKRVHLIIEAMRLVDDLQLYIVGHGPEEDNLRQTAERLGLQDRVFFLQGLTNHQLQIIFSRALAVVFMPIREPFGIVALEAMAASKPLIAVNEGGYTEVVDEECAILIPPTVQAIAEKIIHFRDNPERAERMGQAGRERSHLYSWDRCARELAAIIEDAHEDWMRENPPRKNTARPDGPLFGAHYFMWYEYGLGNRHWNDNRESGGVTQTPSLGHYGSRTGFIIEQHLKWAEHMGLDFLTANLHLDEHGINHVEFEALKSLNNLIQETGSPVRFCIQLCAYNQMDVSLFQAIDLLSLSFFDSPAYLTFQGEPVLFLFWTGQHDSDFQMLSSLKEAARGCLLIASSLRLYDADQEFKLTLDTFDAFSLFSPLELSSRANWKTNWKKAWEDHTAGSKGLRIATVSPGYDDRHLESSLRSGNPYRHVDREQGQVYTRMWSFVLEQEQCPDMVLISTFNEFHENSHIEPTLEHGAQYLDMTRDFIARGRKQWK